MLVATLKIRNIQSIKALILCKKNPLSHDDIRKILPLENALIQKYEK